MQCNADDDDSETLYADSDRMYAVCCGRRRGWTTSQTTMKDIVQLMSSDETLQVQAVYRYVRSSRCQLSACHPGPCRLLLCDGKVFRPLAVISFHAEAITGATARVKSGLTLGGTEYPLMPSVHFCHWLQPCAVSITASCRQCF